ELTRQHRLKKTSRVSGWRPNVSAPTPRTSRSIIWRRVTRRRRGFVFQSNAITKKRADDATTGHLHQERRPVQELRRQRRRDVPTLHAGIRGERAWQDDALRHPAFRFQE